MICVEVAVAAPLAKTLTYLWSDRFAISPAPGQRYLVPLGRRKITGYCLGETAFIPGSALKEIEEVLSPDPLFPPALVPFFKWIADYYHYPSVGRPA